MVERVPAPPKSRLPYADRGRSRVLDWQSKSRENRNQGKCLGTKPGALQYSTYDETNQVQKASQTPQICRFYSSKTREGRPRGLGADGIERPLIITTTEDASPAVTRNALRRSKRKTAIASSKSISYHFIYSLDEISVTENICHHY